MRIQNKNGYFYFGVGSLFLVLIVVFVVIYISMPNMGHQITNAIRELFGSVKG